MNISLQRLPIHLWFKRHQTNGTDVLKSVLSPIFRLLSGQYGRHRPLFPGYVTALNSISDCPTCFELFTGL